MLVTEQELGAGRAQRRGCLGNVSSTLVLSILGPLPFHIDFSISLPLSTKTHVGILIGNVLSPRDPFGENLQLNCVKSSNP